jgi:hypothetical protein
MEQARGAAHANIPHSAPNLDHARLPFRRLAILDVAASEEKRSLPSSLAIQSRPDRTQQADDPYSRSLKFKQKE